MYNTEQIIHVILQALPETQAIYMFGSAGTAFERKDSDLDLALLSKKTLSSTMLWELAQKIAQQIKHNVDLIDLRHTSTVLQFQIITSGTRIFCQNTYHSDLFETFVYSSYQFLNEERKEILQDIRKRGQIL